MLAKQIDPAAIVRRLGSSSGLLPAGLLLTGFLLIPLVSTVLDSLHGPQGWSLKAYAELAQGAFPQILWATLVDSAIVTVGCFCLGLPVAYALTRVSGRWLAVLILTTTVPLFVSSLIRSYSWVAILGNRGLVNQALLFFGVIDHPAKLVYTQGGMLAAMIQVQLPLFILPAYSVMRRIDRRLLRAAQSLGADPVTALFTTFLPLAWPGLAVASLLVFVGSLGFFETPALLGPPGAYFISQSIEVRVNTLGDEAGAAAQAIVLLLLIATLAGIAIVPSRRAFGKPSDPSARRSNVERLRTFKLARGLEQLARRVAPLRWIAIGPLVAATFLLLAAPLIVLVPLAFSSAPYLSFPPPGLSLRWFQAYFVNRDWIEGTLFSLKVGGAAAATATIAGGLAILALAKASARVRIAALLLGSMPLVVSPMVLAVAVYYIAAALGLLGSPLAFIGTFALMGLPYSILVIGAAFLRLDPTLFRAATSLGANPSAVVLTVIVPLLSAAIASAFLFAFVVAFNDLSVSLFLSSTSTKTLSLLMWDDVRQEITPRMAAVAAVLMGGGATVYAIALLARRSLALGQRVVAARARRMAA